MKTIKSHAAAFLLLLTLGALQAEDAKCVPMKPGEAKASQIANNHGGMTLYRSWKIDVDTACIERIVMNADKTVRGRVITTFRGVKPLMSLAYKGMTDPWFTEHWTWPKEGGGYSVETRTFEGKIITTVIFPEDDEGQVKTRDADGNEISDEKYMELSNEVTDLLF